ncbi:VCBS domain-containing protein [Actinoplanes sp. NPDC049599]|uniref:VCBS domain-containing protein n=1 Tax=Actinoplanes sp. NPDC049599 TaxID=3363903 RepID=UPI00378E54CE
MTDAPTLAPLIGTWRTEGEMLGDDGVTVAARVRGSDAYEWLGPFVVHRVDVVIGDRRTQALEIFEPYDAARGAFPTRAYDDRGGVETSTATVDAHGRWTFRAAAAQATLDVAADGTSMRATWVLRGEDGAERTWMRLRFTRGG